MPVTRAEFEKGRAEDSTEAKVLKFLAANPNSAYSSREIAQAIGHSSGAPVDDKDGFDRLSRSFDRLFFGQELEELAKRGLIEQRGVKSGEGWDRFYSHKR